MLCLGLAAFLSGRNNLADLVQPIFFFPCISRSRGKLRGGGFEKAQKETNRSGLVIKAFVANYTTGDLTGAPCFCSAKL